MSLLNWMKLKQGQVTRQQGGLEILSYALFLRSMTRTAGTVL
jgi:hypothetical protein